MTALSEYQAIDLKADKLFAKLSDEAMWSSIELTPVYSKDNRPPYLTPNMYSWYATNVQLYRKSAVQQVRSEFAKRRMPN